RVLFRSGLHHHSGLTEDYAAGGTVTPCGYAVSPFPSWPALKGADFLFHVKHVVCTSPKPNCHVSARGMYVSISGHGAQLFVVPRETVNGRSALCLMCSSSLLIRD